MAHTQIQTNTLPRRRAATRLASLLALALPCALLLSGCGGTDPGATDPDANPTTGPLLPMAVGASWEYKVTDPGTGIITQKLTTVGAMEPIGGTGPFAADSALKVTTRKGANLMDTATLDKTESWQGPQKNPDVPDRIVRYRELSYDASTQMLELEEFWDPPRIHIDGSKEHTAQGKTWIEHYKETKLPAVGTPLLAAPRQDAWTVVDANETVEVLGTTYEHAIHFMKADKQYWYVRGIGKVKETGGQTEELVEYKKGTVP